MPRRTLIAEQHLPIDWKLCRDDGGVHAGCHAAPPRMSCRRRVGDGCSLRCTSCRRDSPICEIVCPRADLSVAQASKRRVSVLPGSVTNAIAV